jgi:hypothetical protein
MSFRAHEGALPTVPLPDHLPDLGRYVALAGLGLASRPSRRRSELLLLELRDEAVQRAIQHLGHVVGANNMTEQGLRVVQLVPSALSDRQSQEVSLLGRRRINMPWGMFTPRPLVGLRLTWQRFAAYLDRNRSLGLGTSMPWGMLVDKFEGQ